ncbi:hypothetical protein AAWM_11206 [Aspergillus awamori]|uniref:Uncharacterized protein n=1 Tax=Aspergillus awamori TaxID=105351 RepID=A0A401L9T7_ASPAW|nr:hypothetical protein AAWM_11206 [Aspergillus awamori]
MTALCDEEPHILGYEYLSTATRPSHPANWSTPRHTTHTKWATCTPHAPIRGHPRPSWRSPGRLAASPSARVPPPSRPVSPRGASHHPISPGQLVNSLRQHARTQLSAGTGRLPAWPPAVSAGRSAAPPYRCSGAAWPAILRANVLWSESDSWGTPTGPPRPGDRLARPTGQWPFVRARGPGRPPCLDPARVKSTRCRIHSVLGWVSPAKSNGQLANEVGRKRRREGPLAHGRESHPRGPLQPPGAAGPQQGYLTAYTTRLVTSVVCRGFIPARGDIAIRQPAPRGFSLGAVASLLRCMARRPIRIQLRRAGQHRRVPARILT